ncbi:MAG: hypothetical protein ACHREM_19845 [Polyangiales bacterium]
MDCAETRDLLLDVRRGRAPADVADAVLAHVRGCEACRAVDAAEVALTEALGKLPRAPAPASLVASLDAKWSPQPRARSRSRRRSSVAGLAVVCALAASFVFLSVRESRSTASSPLVVEAVNDHLRVLYAERPIEIESGGIHQVKPWFAGRLDFAPAMPFAGDDDFALQGGSVAYLVDRKAAAFVFKRRLHVITAFVFRAEGLAFPRPTRAIGHAIVAEQTTRGFHALLWRDGEFGYAVVSDVDPKELETLVGRIAQ